MTSSLTGYTRILYSPEIGTENAYFSPFGGGMETNTYPNLISRMSDGRENSPSSSLSFDDFDPTEHLLRYPGN
jgi:hypothetical protein